MAKVSKKTSGPKGPDKRATLKVTVKFNYDYVAERGAGIVGRKGDTKTYPWSAQLEALFTTVPEGREQPILEKIEEVDSNTKEYKESKAAERREKGIVD